VLGGGESGLFCSASNEDTVSNIAITANRARHLPLAANTGILLP
jgi:hypothetical protein